MEMTVTCGVRRFGMAAAGASRCLRPDAVKRLNYSADRPSRFVGAAAEVFGNPNPQYRNLSSIFGRK
jgi:hypothetical protein